MKMFDIQTGTERGVTWTVDTKTKVNPVILKVESEKGEKIVEHICSHTPIFGYDADDIDDMEKILDKLIEQYATE